jgi:hypothetical protein
MPTRGRPGRLVEAVASIFNNSSGMADILVCYDDDDMTRMDPWPIPVMLQPYFHVMTMVGPRRSFAEWVNIGVMAHVNDYEWVAWGADDVIFKTLEWDQLVLEVKTRGAVVYGRDGHHDKKLPTCPFVETSIPRALGYLIHPALKHYYADNWLADIGQHLNSLTYLADLFTEHIHPDVEKCKTDKTYDEAKASWWERDKKAYSDTVCGYSQQVAKVIAAYILSHVRTNEVTKKAG